MPLVKAEVLAEIRRRLGDPPEAQLPTEQVEVSLSAALREFSRYRPIKESLSLQFVAGVSEYDAPDDGIFAVEDVAVLPNAALGLFMDPELWEAEPYSEFEDGSLMWDRIRKDYLLTKEYIEPDVQLIPGTPPKFRIHPAPVCDGKAELRVKRLVTLETLKESDLEHVIRYAHGDCLEYLGRKRSKSVKKVPTATGQLHLDDGYALRREGRELKEEFRRALGGEATIVGRG